MGVQGGVAARRVFRGLRHPPAQGFALRSNEHVRLRLDLYREVFELQFEVGRLVAVGVPGTGTADVVRLPPPLLAPLLLGYRDLPELAQNYHDVSADGLGAALVQVLFPKVSAFLYAPY